MLNTIFKKIINFLKNKITLFLNLFFKNQIKFKNWIFFLFNLILILNFFIFTWHFCIYVIFITTPFIFFNYFRLNYSLSEWVTKINYCWLKLSFLFIFSELFFLTILIIVYFINPDKFQYLFILTKVIFKSVPNNIRLELYILILLVLLETSLVIYNKFFKNLFNYVIKFIISLILVLIVIILEYECYIMDDYFYYSTKAINSYFFNNLQNLKQSPTEYKILLDYCNLNLLNGYDIIKQPSFKVTVKTISFIKIYNNYVLITLTFILYLLSRITPVKSVKICTLLIENLIAVLFFYTFNYIIIYIIFYDYIIFCFSIDLYLSWTTKTMLSEMLIFFQEELVFNFILV